MIQLQNLVRSFGHTSALRGVNLEVPDGEFLTIVGPNGAGKTTLLRILATLLKPTAGCVRIAGLDVASDAAEVRRKIGFVSHQPLVYGHLTVEENLCFCGRLYDVQGLTQRVDELVHQVGLAARRHSPARTLSRGMQQRLSVARAIIHHPSLFLLDEPYASLDQQGNRMLSDLLRKQGPIGRTVILSTHNLQQALELCDRLIILSKGQIAYQAPGSALTLAQLQEAYAQHVEQSHPTEVGVI